MNDASPLARYVAPLRRWWWVVAGLVVIAMLTAWFTTPTPAHEPTAEEIEDPSVTFRATHILIRNDRATEQVSFDLLLLLARQGDLTGRVLERMDGQIDTADVDEVVLEPDQEIGTLSVTATQPTPDLASDLASIYAQEIQRLVDERADESLQERIDRSVQRQDGLDERVRGLEEEITGLPEDSVDRRLLESELEGLLDEFAMAQSEERSLREQRAELEPQFETLQEPSPVSTASLDDGLLSLPVSTLPRVAIAAFLALVAGALVVLTIDYLDTKVRTRRDAEEAFGLPVIANLPHRSRRERDEGPLPVVSDPSGVTSEALRTLRLSIQLAPTWRLTGQAPTRNGAVGTVAPVERDGEPRTLLVTSSLTGEGKSTLVANLAASYAEADHRVLVIDCDFRRPAVHELLGVPPGQGLREVTAPLAISLENLVVPTSVAGVGLVRAGRPGVPPPWFLALGPTIVEQARELADVVILDTGPMTLTTEAATLVPTVDAALLVARAHRVSRDQAWDTVEQLSRVQAQVSGVVLVGAEQPRRYGYYQAEPQAGAPDSAVPRRWVSRSGSSDQAARS